MICKNIIMNAENNTENVAQKATSNIWPAVIAAGASLAGSALSSWSNSRTNDANLKLAREQNAWNEEMWNKQNEYNTYSNQLQRWTDAGLNANAFAGESSNAQELTSANLANQQADTNTGNILAQGGQNVANSLLQSQLQAQQYDIAKRNLELEGRQVAVQEKLAGIKKEETDSFIKLNDQKIDNLVAEKKLTEEQAEKVKTENAKAQKEIDLMNETIEAAKMANQITKETKEAVVKKSWQDLQKGNAEIAALVAQKDLTYAQYDKAMEDLNYLVNFGEPLASQNFELGGYNIQAKKLENGRIEFELDFRKDTAYTDKYFERGALVVRTVAEGAGLFFGGKAVGKAIGKAFGKSGSRVAGSSAGSFAFPNSSANPVFPSNSTGLGYTGR